MYQVENIGDVQGVMSGPGSESQNINQYSNISEDLLCTSALPPSSHCNALNHQALIVKSENPH